MPYTIKKLNRKRHPCSLQSLCAVTHVMQGVSYTKYMLLADYIARGLDKETVKKILQLFGYNLIGENTPEHLVNAVLSLFNKLQDYLLLTEETLQAFIAKMTLKPTFKKGITLVEKRCQLTHFIQEIVFFYIAIVDGQH